MLMYPRDTPTAAFDQVVSSQYSFITIDGALHWDQMRTSPTGYDFTEADKVVNYAVTHDLDVQAHHLIWDEKDSVPKWLQNGNYSKDQLYDIMHQHINTVMQHYKGKVQAYTVVNEPFSRGKHKYNLNCWWGDHLGGGTEYIDKAFIWAHEADPSATLILNDFDNEVSSDVSDLQYAYMKSAKERGIPIDAIGMQLHVNAADPPSYEAMVKNMKRFGDLGYKVYVTEFDVDTSKVKGTTPYKNQVAARVTADVVRACIDSKSCSSFNVFGMRDPTLFESWQLYWQRHRQPRSYLLSSRYHTKPQFDTFRSALTEQ